MQDMVSIRWVRAATLIASLSFVGFAVSASGPTRDGWLGLAWAALIVATAMVVRLRDGRSASDPIASLKLAPVPATAAVPAIRRGPRVGP